MSGTFVRLVVPDNTVKVRDTGLNPCRENLPEVVAGGIFDNPFRDNFRPKVASNVLSGMTI